MGSHEAQEAERRGAEMDFDQLSPERLLEAAEAALAAARDVAEYTGGPLPYPADLMGSELQPDILSGFTHYEIEQASAFLLRMGWLTKAEPKIN
jgi:hypothetical protein